MINMADEVQRTHWYVDIFLDDLRDTPVGFARRMTVEETINSIKYYQGGRVSGCSDGLVGTLSLDNDLGEGQPEGYKVLDWIEQEVFTNPNFICPAVIKVHSANPSARQRMETVIQRISDFYARKKLNIS